MVENVLNDDGKVYKTINPVIDLTLGNGAYCFVSEVILHCAEPFPGKVEISASNTVNRWNLVKEYVCAKTDETRLELPGEQVAKYLRLRFAKNLRGGNIVSVRYVVVKGLVKPSS